MEKNPDFQRKNTFYICYTENKFISYVYMLISCQMSVLMSSF